MEVDHDNNNDDDLDGNHEEFDEHDDDDDKISVIVQAYRIQRNSDRECCRCQSRWSTRQLLS